MTETGRAAAIRPYKNERSTNTLEVEKDCTDDLKNKNDCENTLAHTGPRQFEGCSGGVGRGNSQYFQGPPHATQFKSQAAWLFQGATYAFESVFETRVQTLENPKKWQNFDLIPQEGIEAKTKMTKTKRFFGTKPKAQTG